MNVGWGEDFSAVFQKARDSVQFSTVFIKRIYLPGFDDSIL